MVTMRGDVCSAQVISTTDGKRRVLLGGKDLCRGVKLEGWTKAPRILEERTGKYVLVPDSHP
jgi:hypothetical protein